MRLKTTISAFTVLLSLALFGCVDNTNIRLLETGQALQRAYANSYQDLLCFLPNPLDLGRSLETIDDITLNKPDGSIFCNTDQRIGNKDFRSTLWRGPYSRYFGGSSGSETIKRFSIEFIDGRTFLAINLDEKYDDSYAIEKCNYIRDNIDIKNYCQVKDGKIYLYLKDTTMESPYASYKRSVSE